MGVVLGLFSSCVQLVNVDECAGRWVSEGEPFKVLVYRRRWKLFLKLVCMYFVFLCIFNCIIIILFIENHHLGGR